MKRYKVEFLPSARMDLVRSFEWGVDVWGKAQAAKWLREMYAVCKKRLEHFPLACPVAPESEDLGREVRHLVIGRYRAIFVVNANIVTVLHVRGAYVPPHFEDAE